MKLSIMQPYFFPYIGHIQLMYASDIFVVYDDVNYFSHPGWINRNKMILDGKEKLFTLALKDANCNRLINEIEIVDHPKNKSNILKTFQYAYRKAPYCKDVIPVLENIILSQESNLSRYVARSLMILCSVLDIQCKFRVSSELENDKTKHGQDKVLDICKLLGATTYINAIGAKDIGLYSPFRFNENGIDLKYLKTRVESKLSIVDILMNHSKDEVKEMLKEYDLI